MGHSNVWNSHPKTYGPGSRAWRRLLSLTLYCTVCAETPMPSSGSTDLCVADSASVAMPRKLDLSSTAEEFKWCEVGRNSSIMSHFSLVFEF
ncbi:hypothetical protein SCA6_006558 [Theobroma cacao]